MMVMLKEKTQTPHGGSKSVAFAIVIPGEKIRNPARENTKRLEKTLS